MRANSCHRAVLLAAGAALLSAPAFPIQDNLAKLETRFAQERDPVRKARAFPDLGEARINLFRQHLRVDDVSAALKILEAYRDDAQTAFEGLKKSGIDAEKHSNGFRQLQIHLRRSLRQLTDLIMTVPYDARESFETIRKELDQMDRQLLTLLFPRRPGKSG
jgi:hypothetical protein